MIYWISLPLWVWRFTFVWVNTRLVHFCLKCMSYRIYSVIKYVCLKNLYIWFLYSYNEFYTVIALKKQNNRFWEANILRTSNGNVRIFFRWKNKYIYINKTWTIESQKMSESQEMISCKVCLYADKKRRVNQVDRYCGHAQGDHSSFLDSLLKKKNPPWRTKKLFYKFRKE